MILVVLGNAVSVGMSAVSKVPIPSEVVVVSVEMSEESVIIVLLSVGEFVVVDSVAVVGVSVVEINEELFSCFFLLI